MRFAIIPVLAFTLVVHPMPVWASQKPVAAVVETQALKEMAAAIPLGSRVKLQTASGRGVKGTLLAVTDTAVIVKKQTRLPEPAVTIPFDELERLERQTHEGVSVAKVIGFGLAAGAGAVLALIGFAIAFAD